MKQSDVNISVIGVGYVGLPLSLALSKKFKINAYDFNIERIKNLSNNNDNNNEISFKKNKNLNFTHNKNDLKKSNIYIITVPTPTNKKKQPDLKLIKNATILVSKYLSINNIVIYESTVYPGLTEEFCVPLLKKYSKLKYKKEFNVGYSPERINPGDSHRSIKNITKLISASNIETLNILKIIYSVVTKKIHICSSIKIAESAKIIENSQRDINIAFVNELSMIFNKMNININEVLNAAKTKWNFLDFKPGLVGGHCIGVDPYYLTYKSLKNNYIPKVILSGRKINDYMYLEYSKVLIKNLKIQFKNNKNIKILFLGFSFKENCSDFRNTQVIKFINYMKNKNYTNIDIYDNLVDQKNVKKMYNIKIINKINCKYDALVLLVPHSKIKDFKTKFLKSILKKNYLIFDPNNIWERKIESITL
jgi:UDP-N-acetyl-D-glucosamine/UDP-N-acetyl-D-galactosamine dehydrogenase